MLSPALFALAAATLCWPWLPVAGRLRSLGPPEVAWSIWRPRWRPTRFTGVATLAALGLLTWPLAGIGVTIAVVAAGGTIGLRWRAHRQARERLALANGMASALRAMVVELRAGVHPASAADGAAAEAPGQAAAVLSVIARTARLGGDVGEAVSRVCVVDPANSAAVRMIASPLARAWSLAARHGLPLADVLDSVRGDVAARVRFARQVHARMAGPRASGTILAVLPVLGVLLGQGMGADPARVLLATSVGHTLLAIGTLLACGGILWIGRLTSLVVLADPPATAEAGS
jgi:tight adherence protein B